MTRLRPEIAETTLNFLDAMELPVVADLVIYQRASRLANDLNHHLFDTFYHAVALERDELSLAPTTVTSARRYISALIVALEAWEP